MWRACSACSPEGGGSSGLGMFCEGREGWGKGEGESRGPGQGRGRIAEGRRQGRKGLEGEGGERARAGYCRPLVHPAACSINTRASASTLCPHFAHTLSTLCHTWSQPGVLQAVDAPGGRRRVFRARGGGRQRPHLYTRRQGRTCCWCCHWRRWWWWWCWGQGECGRARRHGHALCATSVGHQVGC